MSVPLLHLPADIEATFLARRNRFLGVVRLDESEEEVHIHDPGRLEELLWPGNRVLLRWAQRAGRKTKFDLMAAEAHGRWVLVHSGSHRALAEALFQKQECSPFSGIRSIRPEVKVGRSRLDFRITFHDSGPMLVETKGCTLCREGKALFPDAPTERGGRHLMELIRLADSGARTAVVIFITCPNADCFAPNSQTDPKFTELFWRAVERGVEIHPLSISYDGTWLYYEGRVPVCPDGALDPP